MTNLCTPGDHDRQLCLANYHDHDRYDPYAAQFAKQRARAGITRWAGPPTCRQQARAIEQGKDTVSTENPLGVLRILGIMDTVVKSADPYETDVGRLRMDEIPPKRVRD